MTGSGLWPSLWALALAYPVQSIMLLVVVWCLGIVVALCIVSPARQDLPLHQWEDDDEQHRAVSRPAPLHQVDGGHTVDIFPVPERLPMPTPERREQAKIPLKSLHIEPKEPVTPWGRSGGNWWGNP